MLHLVTFGGLALESVNEAVAPRLSAQRLAILAVLAAEGDRRVSRERLTGLFWPDSDEERARHSLRQALYTLRQEIGRDVVRSDFVLGLDRSAITSDVADFRAALARGDRPAAGKLVRGPFLQGFYLPGAASFQRWVEEERARLQTEATSAIASLAAAATATNDLDTAIAWWLQLTTLEPLSGRFALGYLRALAARGDRAEALAFARAHAALVRRELETDADPDVLLLEASLRSTPSPAPAVVATSPRPLLDSGTPAIDAVNHRESTPPVIPRWSRRLTRMALAAGGLIAAGVAAYALGLIPALNARSSDRVANTVADVTTRSPSAYRLYEEGLRAFYRGDGATASQMMRAALNDDSTFAMAAYYDALLTDSPASPSPSNRALRLAERASDRERLVIRAGLMTRGLQSPAAEQIAETLATRYPTDARAMAAVAQVRQTLGDWQGAARALERTIAIDSTTLTSASPCFLCDDLSVLANVYFWWDSLPAAARVARQYTRLRPDWPQSWELAFWAAAKVGDTATARYALRRYTALHQIPRDVGYEVRINILLDAYENVERDLRPLLESPRHDDYFESRWWLLIALRNQGRLREARALNQTGRLPTFAEPQVSPIEPEAINEGLLALESGDARKAATRFVRDWREPLGGDLAPGVEARYHAWQGTLAGMALAATGDTAAVLRLADTVEYWGQRSLFGRDRKLHHYLRGIVLAAAGRDDDAIRELGEAVHSPTLGFTRVNLELGRALLRRNRPREAAAAVAPALRGDIDAANLYVTRTELHELLAQAFDRAGERDSAAVHYATVVRSWAIADPMFHARRDSARIWLARHTTH